MQPDTKIEIALSKAKLAKLLIFSILFLVGGLWMILYKPEVSNPVFNNIVLKTITSYGGVVMGLLGAYFFTKKLFDNRPGIIIDNNGITDHSGALSRGLIPWDKIEMISEGSVQAPLAAKQRFVVIVLKNPQQLLQETNAMKQGLMAMNSISNGPTVHISANGLKIKHRELLQLVTDKFEEYKSSNL
jgi:hypothetical protein